MDLVVFLKEAAAMGLTAPVIVAFGVIWQQQKTNALTDKRISILESKINDLN